MVESEKTGEQFLKCINYFNKFSCSRLTHSGALENLGINRDNGKWQICFLDYLSSIRLVAKLDSIVTCFLLV